MLKMHSPEIGEEIFELGTTKLRWLISREVFLLILALSPGVLFQGNSPREQMLWLLLFLGIVLLALQFLRFDMNAPRIPISQSDRKIVLGILQKSNIKVDAVTLNELHSMPKYNFGILKIPHSSFKNWEPEELGWIVTTVVCREKAQSRLIGITCAFTFVTWVLSVSSVTDQISLAGLILFLSAIIIQVLPLMAWSWKTPDAIATRIYGVEASEKVLCRLLELGIEKNVSVDEVLQRAEYLELEIRSPRDYVRY